MKLQVTLEFDFPYADEPKGILIQNTFDMLRRMISDILQCERRVICNNNLTSQIKESMLTSYDEESRRINTAIENAKYEIIE